MAGDISIGVDRHYICFLFWLCCSLSSMGGIEQETMVYEEPSVQAIRLPVGLSLLLLTLFCMCGLFVCCIYWDRLCSFLGASNDLTAISDIEADTVHSLHKSAAPQMKLEEDEDERRPVLMPGDGLPRFIAIACPYEHPRIQTITALVRFRFGLKLIMFKSKTSPHLEPSIMIHQEFIQLCRIHINIQKKIWKIQSRKRKGKISIHGDGATHLIL